MKEPFLNKNYAEAYNNYGNVFIKEGNLIKQFKNKKSNKFKPKLLSSIFKLRNRILSKKKFEYAIRSYKEKALEISPNLIDAIYNIGNCFIGHRRIKKGLVEFKNSVNISKKSQIEI